MPFQSGKLLNQSITVNQMKVCRSAALPQDTGARHAARLPLGGISYKDYNPAGRKGDHRLAQDMADGLKSWGPFVDA